MSINVRLKILIDILGLKLKDFSRQTGIPYRTLQNYLLGLREPTVENVTKIATRLGVNLNWLLTGEGEMFITQEKEWVVCESPSPYGSDDLTQKILIMLRDMDDESKRDILKHIEEKKLLIELLEERKKLKKAG